MKEVIIIFVCIILVFVGSNISLAYITKISDSIISDVEELKIQIKEKKENDNIIEESDKICKKWEDAKNLLSVIIAHNELDQIELALISIKTYNEEEKYEESIEKINRVIHMLTYLKEREKVDISHIL